MKAIRILLSPFVFLVLVIIMILPGTFALVMGIISSIHLLITAKKNIDWKNQIIYTFSIIWYPTYTTIQYIKKGKFK